MEQTLTPPPSFRALRVLPRIRQPTIVDENCPPKSPTGVKMSTSPCSLVEPCSPVPRGRTRTRTIRGAHARPGAKPKLQISLPAPMLKKNGTLSPENEEELIFQMSPVLSQSPTRFLLSPVDELRSEPLRVQRSAMQTLSSLWEKQKAWSNPEVVFPKSTKRDSQNSTKSQKRTRTGTVTQRVSSDRDDATRAVRSSRRRATENVKAPFDLSSALQAHSTASSPERSSSFLYSFPSIESNSLTKTHKDQPAKEVLVQGERHSFTDAHSTKADGIEGDDCRQPLAEAAQNIGPIRARKLRLQSRETLDDDNESSNFISNAFRSASLQSTHLISESDEGLDTDYEDSFFSHGASSVSSSEIATAEHSVCSEISNSLLESFPIRVPSASPSQSSSRSRHDRFDEMLVRLRAMRDANDARAELGAISEAEALRARGRPRMTHFRRMSEQVQMHANTSSPQRDSHGRTREPLLSRKSGSSVHSTSAVLGWSTK